MLSAIVYTLRDKTVDAVLFMDRLDSYRVDASDVQARWFYQRVMRCTGRVAGTIEAEGLYVAVHVWR